MLTGAHALWRTGLTLRAGLRHAAVLPGLLGPALARLPEGGDWLYEAKLDGYRVQLHRHDGH
ncbi:MAG: hypothetical protein RLZZ221_2827, partial [Verrucomicrobiota bacterium]